MRALASHQCGPGSNTGVDAICGLSLLLVLSFAPRGFSLGTPVFPSPQKPTFPNSNSTRNQVDEEPLCGCATSKSLFIYLFITPQTLSQRGGLLNVRESVLSTSLVLKPTDTCLYSYHLPHISRAPFLVCQSQFQEFAS